MRARVRARVRAKVRARVRVRSHLLDGADLDLIEHLRDVQVVLLLLS